MSSMRAANAPSSSTSAQGSPMHPFMHAQPFYPRQPPPPAQQQQQQQLLQQQQPVSVQPVLVPPQPQAQQSVQAPIPTQVAAGVGSQTGAAPGTQHMYNPYAQPFMPQQHIHPAARYYHPGAPPPPVAYHHHHQHHPLQHFQQPPPHILQYQHQQPQRPFIPPQHLHQHHPLPQKPLVVPPQHQHQQLPLPQPALPGQYLQPVLPVVVVPEPELASHDQQQLLHQDVLNQPHQRTDLQMIDPALESDESAATDEQSASPLFVISRFKYDPRDAPGLTFSPRARPPQDVVDRASKDFPPAPRPAPRPRKQPRIPVPSDPDPEPQIDEPTESQDAITPEDRPASPLAHGETSVLETTPATSIVPETLTPHSPISTNTSISISPKVVNGTPSAHASSLPNELVKASEPAGLPTTPPATTQPLPATSEATIDNAQNSDVNAAPAAAAPPRPPKASAPKKSWADLLRSNANAGTGALPTSSIVGVSVSAEVARASAAIASPVKRAAMQGAVQLLTSTAGPAAALPALRPRGLINSGNLCFANTILQALVYSPPFYKLFAELGRLAAPTSPAQTSNSSHATKPPTRVAVGSYLGGPSTPLVDATVHFLSEFAPAAPNADASRSRSPAQSLESDPFIPTYIYDALKETKRFDSMRRGHQEDAEEFLGFYLDTLEEELLALLASLIPTASGTGANSAAQAKPEPQVVEESASDAGISEDGWTEVGRRNRAVVVTSIKSTESPITRIFGGKFRSVLRTPGSGKDSVLVQDWNRLQLDIQPPHVVTISDALKQLTAPETVHVGPSSSTEASKQVQLDSLPNILVLHIKRFSYDPTLPGGGGVVKNGKHVKFEPVLELSNELMSSARKSTSTPKYRLFAVVYHHGQSATGGHYTLDILHPAPGHVNDPWLRLDDDIVQRIRPDDVFGQDGRDDKVAYLLLYRPTR
ncbi:hypothetical protein BKA62DRAFT_684060 [Auriculariales sp. MPI-PUGE-AT-0066]|nr:hypothetical protein BKA62DRAFT_684060 [Auriculariales sp. MPI-PUGE-AT-0066]